MGSPNEGPNRALFGVRPTGGLRQVAGWPGGPSRPVIGCICCVVWGLKVEARVGTVVGWV